MRQHSSYPQPIGLHTTTLDASALPTMMDPELERAPSGSDSETTTTSSESDSDDFEARVEAYLLGRDEGWVMACTPLQLPPKCPLQAWIAALAGKKYAHAMANCLRSLPQEVLKNIRGYASDRVQPHPTAALIKDAAFYRDVLGDHTPYGHSLPALYVYHPSLTKRVRKCSDLTCLTCMRSNWCCRNSRLVTRPVSRRRYTTSDFTEPDRYMEAYRPKTIVWTDGNVRPKRPAWGLASEEHAFAGTLGDNFPFYHIL